MTTAILLLAALALDGLMGELRCGHPLVIFGRFADRLERRWNGERRAPTTRRLAGAAALAVLVLPAAGVLGWLATLPQGWLVELAVLYLALGLRALTDHARAVGAALVAGDLAAARQALARIVSRDTAHLDGPRVAAGTIESVLENGNDAVLGTIFWFLVAGVPGVVIHRLVNTLDAMWGYRSERFRDFGWAAARLDDILGWLPARLTALTCVLLGGRPRAALACARRQGRRTDSPNAGVVMAAGAGALGIRLGGPGRYHGRRRWRPRFGIGPVPDAQAIERALVLPRAGALLWVLVALLAGWWMCSDMAAIWAR